MNLFRNSLSCINHRSRRWLVQNLPQNIHLKLDDEVNKQLTSDNTKLAFFKEHKGKFSHKTTLPKYLEEAINTVLSDIEPQRLKVDTKILTDHLVERHLPIEQRELESIAQNVIQSYMSTQPSINITTLSPEERKELEQKRQYALVKRLKSSIYHWQPLTFDEYKSKIYLAANFASHYAMLMQIFREIKQRESSFRPVRLLDFGSGVGSVMWAALNFWGKRTFAEILNVDKSREMNELSQLLLQGGRRDKTPLVSGVIYRQFMPHGRENAFDLVVADHTLFEFENRFERLQTVQSLWYNVKPGGFLILVEPGTMHGYKAIIEARGNILDRIAVMKKEANDDKDKENLEESSAKQDNPPMNKIYSPAHIFSPCPHDLTCPKKELNIPCRIATRYRALQIFDLQQTAPAFNRAQMSYIVVQKAERNKDDVYGMWPRIIEPIIDRKNHQHVRLCCPNGQYVNVPISKNKHGVGLHRLSHHAEPGDLFPVIGEPTEEESTDNNENEIVVPQRRRRAFRS